MAESHLFGFVNQEGSTGFGTHIGDTLGGTDSFQDALFVLIWNERVLFDGNQADLAAGCF